MSSQSHLPGGSVSLPEVQEDRGAQEGVLPAEDSPVAEVPREEVELPGDGSISRSKAPVILYHRDQSILPRHLLQEFFSRRSMHQGLLAIPHWVQVLYEGSVRSALQPDWHR